MCGVNDEDQNVDGTFFTSLWYEVGLFQNVTSRALQRCTLDVCRTNGHKWETSCSEFWSYNWTKENVLTGLVLVLIDRTVWLQLMQFPWCPQHRITAWLLMHPWCFMSDLCVLFRNFYLINVCWPTTDIYTSHQNFCSPFFLPWN